MPAVTSCYQVHALNVDAHLSAAMLYYVGANGAETSLLLTAYCIEYSSPYPRRKIVNGSCITLLRLHHNHKMSITYHKNGLVSIVTNPIEDGLFFMCFVIRTF